MNKLLLSFLLFYLTTNLVKSQDGNEPIKPLTKIDVFINGELFSVFDGDTIHTDNNTIVVKTSNQMSFNYGVISFDYPKYFAYQFEENNGLTSWSLDGNDVVVSYYIFWVEIKLEAFIDELVKKFGKKNCTVSEKQIRLGNNDLSGKRILVEMMGTMLTYDIFQLETNDSKFHLIAFQDSKNTDGSDSDEFKETMDLINKTIKIK